MPVCAPPVSTSARFAGPDETGRGEPRQHRPGLVGRRLRLAVDGEQHATEQAAGQAAGVGRRGQLRAAGQQLRGELTQLPGPRGVADRLRELDLPRHPSAGLAEQRHDRLPVAAVRAAGHEHDRLSVQRTAHGRRGDPLRELRPRPLLGRERVALDGEVDDPGLEIVAFQADRGEQPVGQPARPEYDPHREREEDRGEGYRVVAQ